MWYCKSITLQKQANKLIEKEIRFVVTRGEGWRRGNWRKTIKRHKFPAVR